MNLRFIRFCGCILQDMWRKRSFGGSSGRTSSILCLCVPGIVVRFLQSLTHAFDPAVQPCPAVSDGSDEGDEIRQDGTDAPDDRSSDKFHPHPHQSASSQAQKAPEKSFSADVECSRGIDPQHPGSQFVAHGVNRHNGERVGNVNAQRGGDGIDTEQGSQGKRQDRLNAESWRVGNEDPEGKSKCDFTGRTFEGDQLVPQTFQFYI